MKQYGFHLWVTNSNSNINVIKRFQSKTFRGIVGTTRYVTNGIISQDLKISSVGIVVYDLNDPIKPVKSFSQNTRALGIKRFRSKLSCSFYTIYICSHILTSAKYCLTTVLFTLILFWIYKIH